MARINLLPWRAALRRERQKEFALWTGLGLALTAAMMLLIRTQISAAMDTQNRRNQYLEGEIGALERQIAEIRDLEAKKSRLVAKMEIIQQLQLSRPEEVHLFDEIARTVPEGVSLRDLTQEERAITVNGFAQSNARVSAYMRNLEGSEWLYDPVLEVIENKQDAQGRGKEREKGSRFTLRMKQGPRGRTGEESLPGGKAAP
ncbi:MULTISPECIES: PilN domain-containing protein [Methylococcus]|jgi:type IV pilus assembly protein PilN|nr:PilN domain-containing protein [Methylococcus capsulatus]QXP88845.1 PilN domain-containing protein [Methylococcus capsulatus]QXP89774.1 PilN domain-containing protein [Methylococcus capsulatus]QXP94121.1 PilN domain-containing protein [Methylococcus capsulatus]UQN11136.1 PilN domain-containing protein [Methylococcus capsulatus]CAI8773003.1 type IV pilus assembly protein PilN [Methylococcus capsulatus]